MFKAFALVALMISGAAMADVELRLSSGRPHMVCTIKNNEVVRQMSFGKEKKVKMTQKSQFTFEGLEAAARDAAKFASNTVPSEDMESFSLIIDGKTYQLTTSESVEALALMQLMVKACQL